MNEKIYISIIIPVFNHANGLKDTLESLCQLSYPLENVEVIVVDNNSTDNTLDIARSFEKNYPGFIKSLSETAVQSSYAARNKGISHAKGEIIVFLDADITVGADLLRDIEKVFQDPDVLYLGFDLKVRSCEKENIFEKYDRMTGFPIARFIEHKHFSPTACLAVRKKLFDIVGTFESALVSSGDYEFGNRVHNAGLKLYFEPSISVYHPARNSFKALLKQSARKGRGKAQLKKCRTRLHDMPVGSREKYHPLSLPGRIRNFKNKVKGWEKLSILQKTGFFFIWLGMAIAEKTGYISETTQKG